MKKAIWLLALVLFCWTGIAIAGVGLKVIPIPSTKKLRVRKFPDSQCQYYLYSLDSVKVSWTQQTGATFYNVRLATLEETRTYYEIVSTSMLEAVLPKPRSGKFIVQMCVSPCESWIDSTDSTNATVSGRSAGWWVYFP